MVKKIVSISIDSKLLKEIENLFYQELENHAKNKKKLSKSEFIEKLIKLGIRARKEGFLFI